MANIEFIFNTTPTVIQCQKEDLMMNICQKFCTKINNEINNMIFLYEGKKINYQLTFKEQANENDRKEGIMNILVYQNEYMNNNETQKIIDSKEIICPKCGEVCLVNMHNYKISFYDCKKEEKLNNILLDEFEYIQKIDQSKIICDDCKSTNKSNVYNNEFYICLSCDKNICPICKSNHDKKHVIINYELKNYICKIHNEKFNSYCNKCKINLCVLCESEHKDRNNIIYYGNIIPKKDIFKSQMDELKKKIEKYNEKIKEIINEINKILNKVSKNLEIYYNINNNLFENFEKKNRNYQLFTNINEIINSNYIIINDINKIINESEIINSFNNIIGIYNKMDNKYNARNNEDNNNFNEIIAQYEIKEGDKKIKIFGDEFIKNNINNFELFINGELIAIRDEITNFFWENKEKIIEIKLLEKKKVHRHEKYVLWM